MYTDFFQLNALPINQLQGNYDLKLVLLSFIVASMVSYIALDLTGRLRDPNCSKSETLYWLLGGALAMGAGIWSMHFIGMLSFSIPGLILQYDLFWTVLSFFVAVFASFFALFLLKKSTLNLIHFIGGGVILGLAIASMHYTGMTAMLISLNISYLPGLFLLSILVAIVASMAAIWLALKSNTVVIKLRNRIKILSALIMGLAICCMHYIGMWSSVFTPLYFFIASTPIAGVHGVLDQTLLASIIAAVTLGILAIAFFTSSFKEAKNQKQFEKARQLGMAEMSASVLHNVGNVINSVNVSIETLISNHNESVLKEIPKLAVLLQEHQENIGQFLTEDPKGKLIIPYLKEMASCWEKEHKEVEHELKELSKNIGLIKELIATQQNVFKVGCFEEIVSINELIEESLILSGIHVNKSIEVIKNSEEIKPVLLDKIKFLQVLNNLISNAKDALLESSNPEKKLTIKTHLLNAKTIEIQIVDNGVGITKENLGKIFIFGFTTKKSGHGFGLHSAALAVNELGGKATIQSEGHEKGTAVIIHLPNRQPSTLTPIQGAPK